MGYIVSSRQHGYIVKPFFKKKPKRFLWQDGRLEASSCDPVNEKSQGNKGQTRFQTLKERKSIGHYKTGNRTA
jgi:hypothetical protein